MAAARAHRTPRAGADSLPDDLLAHILELAGQQEWPSVTLVSKRWARLVWSTPALWRTLCIKAPLALQHAAAGTQTAWFAGTQHLLQLVGGMVQQCSVLDPEGAADAAGITKVPGWWDLTSMLCLLRPEALTSLEIESSWPRQPEGDLMGLLPCTTTHLGTFSHLTSLSLHAPVYADHALLGALKQLTQLRRLHCHAVKLPDDLVDTVASSLPLLHDLGISALCKLPPLDPLWGMEQLQCLTVGSPDIFQLYAGKYVRHTLEYLHEWCDTADGQKVSGSVTGKYDFWYKTQKGQPHSSLLVIDVHRVASMPSPEELAAALLPAAAVAAAVRPNLPPPISEPLAVQDHHPGLLWPALLAGLHTLQLLGYGNTSVMERDLPLLHTTTLFTLLQHTGHLQSLTVGRFQLSGGLPASLAGLTHLRWLSLTDLELRSHELPAGPYLQGLHELDVGKNCLTTLPPVLVAATTLRRLRLSGNYDLTLVEGDVEGCLALMPHLEELAVSRATNYNSGYAVMSSIGFERIHFEHTH